MSSNLRDKAPQVFRPTGVRAAVGRYAGAGAILLMALIWRLLGVSDTDVWRDEAITLIHTRAGWLDLLVRLPRVEDSPPLGFLLFKLWSLASSSEIWMRLLPVLAGVATVGVLMKTAALIVPRAWWAAGLIAAVSHVPVHYSQELRVYSLLLLLTSLCLLATERVAGGAGRTWKLAWVGIGALAAHAHVVGLFVFPMTVVYLVVRSPRETLRRLVLRPMGLPIWLLLVAPIVLFAFHWSRQHAELQNWWIPPLTGSGATRLGQQFFGLGAIQTLLEGRGVAALWIAFAVERVVMLTAAFLAAAALLDPALRRRSIALAAAAACFLALMGISSALSVPNLLERTIAPAWLPIVLLLSLGAAATIKTWLRTVQVGAVAALVAIFATGWLWVVYGGPPRRVESRAMFEWVKDRIGPEDIVVSIPSWQEDMVVYGLGDRVAAEQLFSEGTTVYAGRPPKHQMIPRMPAESWDRIESAIRSRRDSGATYAVWLITYRFAPGETEPGSVRAMLARDHQLLEFSSEGFWDSWALRYVPVAPANSLPASP